MPANQGFSRPLATLLRWWLQRQVTQVQALEVSLQDASQVWLSGCLPYIQVSAQNIIYQKMHLQEVALTAQAIRFHLPFLQKKGQPFVEPITVKIQATITEQNVNASLPYIQETLSSYLREFYSEITQIQAIKIYPDEIRWLLDDQTQLLTQINLVTPNELMLHSDDKQIIVYLGTDVQIQELKLQPGSIHLSGDLIIRPAAPTG
ncbi:DUF2993 domain-containing protein [Gloeomargaritales cyanobacterium VI4D9]|nr:DUF2993 domain-containing protein [Gloeomargaritales cyanobacterium VI4D9]